jgi:hypothetical protein
MPTTFPLNQTIYLDFSHDTNIASIVTALGLTQFSTLLPADGPPPKNYTAYASRIAPFGARMDFEIITTPHPLMANRPFNCNSANSSHCYESGGETKYIHLLINQRTIPLGLNHADCGDRVDGWCELKTFIAWQQANLPLAQFEKACFGNLTNLPYGSVSNGVPISSQYADLVT